MAWTEWNTRTILASYEQVRFLTPFFMKIKQKLFTSNKSKGVNTCDYIVLHHTATSEGSIAWVLRTLTVGMVSCHYVVDTNGDIYQIGEDKDILWHAGVSSWEGKEDMNRYSIGIEIIWPLKNGGFTDEQRIAVRGLVLDLMERHRIGKRQVIRHKDISPGRKIDVQDSFWNGQHKTFAQYQDFLTAPPVETETEKRVREFADEHGIRKRWSDETYTCFEMLSILSKLHQ